MERNIDVGGYGTILQIVLYFIAFAGIIYVLYKLFGMFKDWGSKIEKTIHEAWDIVNPSDLPKKTEETVKDVETIAKGAITGKTNTPEYNTAKTNLHYGGAEWEPGNAKVNTKTGEVKKYGKTIKPGESRTFAGGTYIETVKNNLTKDVKGEGYEGTGYHGSGYVTEEDALAHKYGFSDYAVFSAWLAGVKTALKADGKDPNSMSLDAIVAYGKELKKKQEAYQNTLQLDTGTPDPECIVTPEEAAKMSDEELEALYEKCKRKHGYSGNYSSRIARASDGLINRVLPVDPHRRVFAR